MNQCDAFEFLALPVELLAHLLGLLDAKSIVSRKRVRLRLQNHSHRNQQYLYDTV
jgi:hypothetical protein